MSKLILVDAHSYLHRAYHALPPLTTSQGQPVNAVYGFIRMIFKLIAENRPEYMVICFDAAGPTFRHQLYSEYKATRKETEENLRVQFPLSREIVDTFGLASFEVSGYEADDLIATLAGQAGKQDFEVLIVSGDKDILQMVDEKTKVLNEMQKVLYDSKKVKEKWGVEPSKLVDVLALMGDSSDNVPGVPGVGEKTAVKLIQDFGSVDGLMQNLDKLSVKLKDKIQNNKEQLFQSRKLCTLEMNVPIEIAWEKYQLKPLEQGKVVPLLKKLGFHNLLNDLFSKGILSTPKEEIEKFSAHYETILTKDQLDRLVQTLSPTEQIAIDVETTGLNIQRSELVGISVSWGKEFAAYIPLRHAYLGAPEQLSPDVVLNSLRPVLENKNIKKIGQNLKFDFSMLAEAGVRIKNLYFDTMLASYCLDPGRNSHGLKDLALEFLGRHMTRLEELVAKPSSRSKSQEMAMDKVEINKVAPYACADADCTLQLSEKLASLLKEKKCESLFYDIEMPLVEILSDMEMTGIKVNTAYLEELNQEFSKEIRQIEIDAHRLAGQEFNLGSPKQLAFILFEKLKLPAVRKTKTGFSTDEDVLVFLSSSHELPRILLRYRELSKLKSTYIEGLLAQVNPKNSKVHTWFNQVGTVTGRLSSNEPNLQNIPIRTEHGRMIRRAFVPEEGYIFLSADYSQIDLRVLAHLSGDTVLCNAFREGADIHRATASEVFHVPTEKVSEEERKRAKAINFGIVYGQQSYGLSQSLKIPFSEAQKMIDHYFEKYSGIKTWIEKIKEEARRDGYVKTLLGRIRYLPEINSTNGAIRGFAERTAMNTPVQGTSADIIKVAMIKINEKLKTQNSKLRARMLLQVHDDLLFEVPEDQIGSVANMVKQEMEHAIKLSVPITVDLKTGKNWADMTAYKFQ